MPQGRTARHGRLDARGATARAVRHGVTAARQPLELLGPGSNPGGGAWTRQLAIIVLAAGQGTRMKSATPKLLHPLAGSPIVAHVLRTANALDAAHVVAVVRHERDQVAAEVEAVMPGIVVVDQDEIPGTGRAVEQALAALPDDFEGEVLVLNGDVPLLDADTLAAFLEQHRGHAAAGIRALGRRTTTRPATAASCADADGGVRPHRRAEGRHRRRACDRRDQRRHLRVRRRRRCATSSRTSRPTTRRARSTSPT